MGKTTKEKIIGKLLDALIFVITRATRGLTDFRKWYKSETLRWDDDHDEILREVDRKLHKDYLKKGRR